MGANCYIKLFRNISELDTEQKKEAQTLTTTLKKEKSKLEEIYEKKEMFVRDIMVSLESVRNQLESLNIPMKEDFSSYLEVTEEKELIRIVKILDDALRKYQIELNKLAEISKNKESNTRINKSEDDGSVADFWRNFNRKKRNNY